MNRPRVRAYYEAKTSQILAKYGPGPRVHFHTGLVASSSRRVALEEAGHPKALRDILVASQERLLQVCAKEWNAERHLSADVLDVGCGLGGTALFLAEEYGARVTALTDTPLHGPMVESFAAEAGVSDRVQVLLSDAHAVPDTRRFQSAVAIESSCYFDRRAWFRCLAGVIPRRGRVHIVDCFRNDEADAAFFDEYWLCRLGALDEYLDSAARAGFELLLTRSLNEQAARFWEVSRLYTEAVLLKETLAIEDQTRLLVSMSAHGKFQRFFEDRSVLDRSLVFERVS